MEHAYERGRTCLCHCNDSLAALNTRGTPISRTLHKRCHQKTRPGRKKTMDRTLECVLWLILRGMLDSRSIKKTPLDRIFSLFIRIYRLCVSLILRSILLKKIKNPVFFFQIPPPPKKKIKNYFFPN